MEKRRKKKYRPNYCRKCNVKIKKHRVTCPYCGKFIFSKIPLVLLIAGIFIGFVYLILYIIDSFPPLLRRF